MTTVTYEGKTYPRTTFEISITELVARCGADSYSVVDSGRCDGRLYIWVNKTDAPEGSTAWMIPGRMHVNGQPKFGWWVRIAEIEYLLKDLGKSLDAAPADFQKK
jgi:hypothetical protein